jgi:hypothetical protein
MNKFVIIIAILTIIIGFLYFENKNQEERISILIDSIDEKNKQFDDLHFQYRQYKNLYLSSDEIKLSPAIYIPPGKKEF